MRKNKEIHNSSIIALHFHMKDNKFVYSIWFVSETYQKVKMIDLTI